MSALPQMPGESYSVSSAAFYTYIMNKNQLNTLCSELTTGAFLSGVTNIFPDPVQNIRSAHIYPFDIIQVANLTTQSELIKISNYTMLDATSSAVCNNPIKLIDVGEIKVDRIYKNFLDYPPYTEYQLWLPYIGSVDLNADVVGHTLKIQYAIDIPSGYATAYVKDAEAGTIYIQRSGTIGLSIPISGYNSVDYNRQKNNAIFSAAASGTTAIIGFASGNVPMGIAGTTALATGIATSMLNAHKNIVQSTQADTMTPFYDPQECFLVRNRPNVYYPIGYAHQYGKPSNRIETLSTLNGYTKISDVHMEGFEGATQTEIDEIEMLLKEGVIL